MSSILADFPLKLNIMKNFGNNLKFYRQTKQLSQKKLGELLGFSARTVSDWECGNTEPDIKTIKQIVLILEITLDELFDF